MKSFFLLLLLAATVHAQTNLTFDTLETRQGSYTNVQFSTITAAYVIARHETGIAKIFITNLPPDIQKQIGYDPQKADEQAAKEAAHKKASLAAARARAEYLATLVGPVQTVRLVSIVDNFGQCVIAGTNGQMRVYMLSLPANVKNYLVNYQNLKAYIATETERVKELKADAARADAVAPTAAGGTAAYVNNAMAQRDRANLMALEAKTAAESLADSKTKLAEMQIGLSEGTTFNAYNTGLQDNGIPRWQTVE